MKIVERLKKRKKSIIASAIILTISILLFKHGSSEMPSINPVTVEASSVKEEALPLEVNATGTLVAKQSTDISPEVAGQVNEILFKDGTFVESGAPLVQLEATTYKAQNDSAKAKLALSENKFKRMQALAKKDYVSQQTIDELMADLKERRADAQEADVMLKKMTLKAPFAGMVGKANVNIGNYVTSGQHLLTLTDTKHLRVEYNVPEKYLPLLQLNQTVSMKVEAYPGQLFVGKVAYISPTINTENRSIALYADIPNEDNKLKTGMFVTVTQSLGNEAHALMIPARSLMPAMEGQQVYRVINGKADIVKVVIGRRTDDYVQITQGLAAGDMVITDGQHKVQPGMPVKLKS